MWREWTNAQCTIKANASPLADRGDSSAEHVLEARPDPSRTDGSETQDELAQVDVSRPAEPAGGGANANAAIESKPAMPARFGYDLEHGIPMPPDARESRSVY
jgi:hypothetical protein